MPPLNPLLEAPFVKHRIFRMDWLHAADQGITADFIGNLFYVLVDKFPGDTIEDQYSAIFNEMDKYYNEFGVDDRMDCMTPGSIRANGSSGMKLRTSAAKCRKLVPFAYKLALETCDLSDPVEQALCTAADHLNQVYGGLTRDCLAADKMMKDESIKFAVQYVALHDHFKELDDRQFRIKPKMHFFLHLCSDGGCPSRAWCYRDEDFGGSVAKAAHRRGGTLSVQATSMKILTALKIGTPRICIRPPQ